MSDLLIVLAILFLGLYVVFTLSSKGIIGKIGSSKIEKAFYIVYLVHIKYIRNRNSFVIL